MLLFLAHDLILFLLALPLFFFVTGKPKTALCAALSIILAAFVGFVIKNFYYLPRPFIFTGTPPPGFLLDGTFPSNHTGVGFAAAFSVLHTFRRTGLVLLFLAFLVGLSRVVLGIHYSLDILGGILIGYFSSLLVTRGLTSCHS